MRQLLIFLFFATFAHSQSLLFDNRDDFISISPSEEVENMEGITISTWIYKEKNSAIISLNAKELSDFGHIYMHRFRPDYDMYARPISEYPANSKKAACIMLMIQNNLDPAVAQYPHELVTYGGNGSVFQNWIQYRITMHYLSIMNENQTLVCFDCHN